jgi:hypothetical protein
MRPSFRTPRAVEELSICPAEKLNLDGEGEPSPSTATQRHCLEIRDDRVYEPYRAYREFSKRLSP